MWQELKRILSIALAISVIVSLATLLIMLASKDAKISKLNRQLEAKPKEVYIEVPIVVKQEAEGSTSTKQFVNKPKAIVRESHKPMVVERLSLSDILIDTDSFVYRDKFLTFSLTKDTFNFVLDSSFKLDVTKIKRCWIFSPRYVKVSIDYISPYLADTTVVAKVNR